MGENKNIKEIMEVLAALKVLVKAGKEIAADGKVDVSDLKSLVPVLTQFGVFIEAVKGANEISGEVKDLDTTELVTIVTEIYQIIKA